MKNKFLVALGSISTIMAGLMVTASACVGGAHEHPIPEGLKDKI